MSEGAGDDTPGQYVLDMAATPDAPIASAPSADRILRGMPQWRTWLSMREHGNSSGRWESTPGAWTMNYDKWEFCAVLSGSGRITPLGGEPIELKAGSTLTIRPGFRGTWEVDETMTKYFFVRQA
ncbi:MAG: cupin domain-containing protein [Flavobacteriaceae bacterium]